MSTFRDTAKYVKHLKDHEYTILKSIERLSRRFERVSIKWLINLTGFSESYIFQIIDNLSKHGFISYFEQPYESVMLLTSGTDLLALKKLANRGIVVGIGKQIGVGKEADVYEAINEDDTKVSLKIFRLGRISFKGITRKRSYSIKKSSYKWFRRNYISARREYENLVKVYQRGVSVPRPYYQVMHMLVMEFLDGFLLNDLENPNDPYILYTSIIHEIVKTWNLGFVNGDLSEYNIFILKERMKPVIIDWPQTVSRGEPNSKELLKRDLKNIIRFFKKRYGCEEDTLIEIIKDMDLELVSLLE